MAAPRIQLVLSESSVSIANNSSVVTGTLYYYGNGESWNTNTACSITINGSTKNFAVNIGRYTNGVIGSHSVTVYRNSDGNKTISYSAYADVSAYYGTTRTSGSYACQWIKRATTPTLSASTIKYGESVTINLPRADAGFTHKLYYSVGNGWVSIATGVETSYKWIVPKSLANSAKENPTKATTIQAETYSGGTLIGYKNVTLNVKPSADMVPTVGISLTDPTGHLTTYGGFVKNQSKIKCTLTEGLSYESPIKSRNVTIDGNNYTTNPATTVNPITSTKVTATITDGRGMSASATAQPTLIDWYQPKLTDLRVQRCTPGGTLQEDGDCIRVDFAVDIASLGTKKPNSKSLKISIKKQTEQNYGSPVTITLDGYKYQGYKVLTTSGDSGYDIHIELTDDFTTTTVEKQIGTAYSLINWNASGKGMAIGKVSEKDAFEVAMATEFKDTVKIGNIDYTMTDAECQTLLDLLGGGIARLIDWIYPIGAVVASSNKDFDPNKLYSHQTWERYAKGRTLVGVDENDTDFSTADKTGGEKMHALTEKEMPRHRHSIIGYSSSGNDYSHSDASLSFSYNTTLKGWSGYTVSAGEGTAHNNMQPYVTVYYWRRKA